MCPARGRFQAFAPRGQIPRKFQGRARRPRSILRALAASAGLIALISSAFGFVLLAPAAGLGGFGGLPLILLMVVAMYFLLVAPNQRKQKQWQTMLSQLKSGDRVTTSGGIRGSVISVKDDVVVVRTQPDGVKLEIVKSAIAAVTTEEETKA